MENPAASDAKPKRGKAQKFFFAILKAYGSLRIRWKIFLSYVLLLVITIPAIGFFSFSNTASIAQNRYTDALNNTLGRLAVDIGNRMRGVEESAEILAWQTDLRNILSKQIGDYSFSDQMRDMEALERTVQVPSGMNDVHLSIYIKNQAIYSRERQNFFPLDEFPAEDLHRNMIDSHLQLAWGMIEKPQLTSTESRKTIICIKPIMHQDHIFEEIGILLFSLDKNVLDQLLVQSKLTPGCGMFLLDPDGRIMSSNRGGEDNPVLPDYRPDADGMINADGTQYYYLKTGIPNQTWRLAALIPEEDIRSPINDVVKLYLAIVVSVLLIALLLSALLSASLTGRITRLAALMKKRQDDSEQVVLADVAQDDEIGELQSTYNQMLLRNQQLINQVYRAKIREREAELKALQAQINPHFLYNTLNTINWMALEAGAKSVSVIVDLLANFFRMSLKSGKSIITVAEEIQHAKTYLEIQKFRLGSSLTYTVEADQSILGCPIIKLILQPLVENAIIHGIQRNVTQSGSIRITGFRREDLVTLVVEDDGPGFEGTPEQVLSLKEDGAQSYGGYGIYNTDQRLKITFGPQYGLRYEKAASGGTRAIIDLPGQYSE